MSEETVVNVEQGARACRIFCNWCTETFTYQEDPGEVAHENTTCPWCRVKLRIPRNLLRRINGVTQRVRR